LPVVIIIAIAAIIVAKIITDARIKQKLIEKGMVDEQDSQLFWKRPKENPTVHLKWVLFLMAFFIPVALRAGWPNVISPDTLISLMIIIPGAAIFIYYLMAKKEYDRNKTEKKD
ncbi:MAG: hypothetical protein GY863_10965, partial [bacterium]|nr:hypothetical protein [bacterium]